MDHVEESRKVVKLLRLWKGKGSVLLLLCHHSKPRSPDMDMFYSLMDISLFSIA